MFQVCLSSVPEWMLCEYFCEYHASILLLVWHSFLVFAFVSSSPVGFPSQFSWFQVVFEVSWCILGLSGPLAFGMVLGGPFRLAPLLGSFGCLREPLGEAQGSGKIGHTMDGVS